MKPHSLTVADACRRYGFGRTMLYGLISKKKVEAVKLGARTLILADSVEQYLVSLPRLGAESHNALSDSDEALPPSGGAA